MASTRTITQQAERQEKVPVPPRTNALAAIQYASLVEADVGASSGDDAAYVREMEADDAQAIVAVSMGLEQTRLTSTRTPAFEKAAVLEQSGGYFEELDGIPQQDESDTSGSPPAQDFLGDSSTSQDTVLNQGTLHNTGLTTRQRTVTASVSKVPHNSQSQSQLRSHLTTPTKASHGKRKHSLSSRVKNSLNDTLGHHRRGSSLGEHLPSISLPSFAKNFNFSVSSLVPSVSLFDGPGGSKHTEQQQKPEINESSISAAQSNRRALQSRPNVPLRRSTINEVPEDFQAQIPRPRPVSKPSDTSNDVPVEQSQSEGQQKTTHPASLKRSASDESLWLRKSMSLAPSLGDDSRFTHVQQQVNSRVKAMKDTWEDMDWNLSREGRALLGKFNLLPSTHSKTVEPLQLPIGSETSRTLPPPSFGKIKPKEMAAADRLRHPHFSHALEELTGDVVVLGGYRGSILRSAETKRRLWAPVKVSLNLRKVDLEVGIDPETAETEEARIYPDGTLTNIGPIDISRRLLERLAGCENSKRGKLRVHNYGYDWRLDPHKLSSQMLDFLETLPCNQKGQPASQRGAIVIAHSLGGLITRHAVNIKPQLFSGVLYAGTPQHAVNILGPLRNGDDVGLNAEVLTAQVNFTFRTSFALLPLDGTCFTDKTTGEAIPVDFFNPRDWIKYAWSPCISRPVPEFKQKTHSGPLDTIVGTVSSAIPVMPSFGRKDGKEATNMSESDASKLKESQSTDDSLRGSQSASKELYPPAVQVTIPFDDAYKYLERTLASVKQFKQELDFKEELASNNQYPPFSVLSATNTPTVTGTKVDGEDGIGRQGAYDNLTFGSGDGVVLARAAQLPAGYRVVRGGDRRTRKGHVSLLSDLEQVGRCLLALLQARRTGTGAGHD